MVYTRACLLVCIILTMQGIYEGNEDVAGCYLGMFLIVWYGYIRSINLLSVKVLLLAQGGLVWDLDLCNFFEKYIKIFPESGPQIIL